jgi:hypothetical protein
MSRFRQHLWFCVAAVCLTSTFSLLWQSEIDVAPEDLPQVVPVSRQVIRTPEELSRYQDSVRTAGLDGTPRDSLTVPVRQLSSPSPLVPPASPPTGTSLTFPESPAVRQAGYQPDLSYSPSTAVWLQGNIEPLPASSIP